MCPHNFAEMCYCYSFNKITLAWRRYVLTSLSHTHTQTIVISPLQRFSWFDKDPDTVQLYIDYLANLISAQTFYLKSTLTSLLQQLWIPTNPARVSCNYGYGHHSTVSTHGSISAHATPHQELSQKAIFQWDAMIVSVGPDAMLIIYDV